MCEKKEARRACASPQLGISSEGMGCTCATARSRPWAGQGGPVCSSVVLLPVLPGVPRPLCQVLKAVILPSTLPVAKACLLMLSQSVQSLSCLTLCDPMDCCPPGSPVSHQLLELTQTHVHRVSDVINHILCRPILLPPSVFPSIRIFSSESVFHIRWPKYWSFSFSISPSNDYSGLISFRMDCLDLLAVQGDSQESSPTPKFKSISSSALSFLYSPTLTSIHDHWKNHRFD